MRQRNSELSAVRLVGDKGDEVLHVGLDARATEAALDDVLGVKTLDLVHAPEQPLLEIHHLIGIGEIARQMGIGAVELASALAEITGLERGILGAARLLRERFAP